MSGLFIPQWFGGNGVFAPQFMASGGFTAAQTDALAMADVLAGALPTQYNRSQTDSLALDSIQVSVLGVAFQVNQADALNLIETLSAAAQGGVLMVNPYRVIADLLGVLRLVIDEDPKP